MVAIFSEDSRNAKIAGRGRVSATYASIQGSCPSTCALKGDGCYAQIGRTSIHVRRLDAQVYEGMRPEAVARAERRAIREAFKGGPIPQDGEKGGRDMRMHVSGDARTRRAANILGSAAKEWRERGGGDVWTYTHAAMTVPRKEWGDSISVLASTEDPAQIPALREQGYAPALVVQKHLSDKAYKVEGCDTEFIPCVEQTRGVACSSCRLCFNDEWLRANNKGIAFEAHGPTRKIRKHLKVMAA